jgi:hypothetical protein
MRWAAGEWGTEIGVPFARVYAEASSSMPGDARARPTRDHS